MAFMHAQRSELSLYRCIRLGKSIEDPLSLVSLWNQYK